MPTEIKSIKCPQCGSTENTALGNNHYRCKKCGTEYFLDNNDININYKVYSNVASADDVSEKAPANHTGGGGYCGCSVLIILLIIIISIIISFFSGNKKNSIDEINGSVEWTEPVVSNGKPYIFVLSRDYNEKSYFAFMDAASGKIVKNEKFPIDSIQSLNFDCTVFSNGKIYFIANRKIFVMDNNNMTIQDITAAMFASDSVYASGIASISTSEGEGDCFLITTNMGQEYYYYPIVKKSHSSKKINNIATTVQPNAKDTTLFAFTKDENDYDMMDDKAKEHELLKIKYKYNNGDAQKAMSAPTWSDNGSLHFGSFKNFIVSHTNFTPDRIYFKPQIIFQNTGYLLISVTATASSTDVNLQRINTQTGALMWTTPVESNYFGSTVHANGIFVIQTGNYKFMIVDDDGKIVRNINLDRK